MTDIDAIVVSASPGETRLALLRDGLPVEIIVDRGDAQRGDVLLARVVHVNRRAHVAFLDIGADQPGFLPAPGALGEGDACVVQVVAAARRDKGAVLALRQAGLPDGGTGSVELAATDATPPARLSLRSPLERALAEHDGIRHLTVDDPTTLPEARRLFPAATLQTASFETCGAADLLEQALSPRVPLPGGGAIVIEETAAYTTIDIDAGSRPPMEANLAALALIAAHIRLRGLAGHLLVDVIPSKNRPAFSAMLDSFRRTLRENPQPARVVGVTPLGSIELTRPRRRPSLGEIMLEPRAPILSPASLGLAGIRAVLAAVAASPGFRPTLVVPPRALEAVRRRPDWLSAVAARLGRPLPLREAETVDTFDVVEER